VKMSVLTNPGRFISFVSLFSSSGKKGSTR
jgi:hypothetical protein